MKRALAALVLINAALIAALVYVVTTAPVRPTMIDPGFSPGGSAEALVLRAIDSAQSSIRLAVYSFTSPTIARALIEASRRGVDVAVVVDERANLVENRARTARLALNMLANAGIPTRTVSSITVHSKYIVIDGAHVELGSFNDTTSAARYNAENVIVIWNRPDIAKPYLDNWTAIYDQGRPYTSTY